MHDLAWFGFDCVVHGQHNATCHGCLAALHVPIWGTYTVSILAAAVHCTLWAGVAAMQVQVLPALLTVMHVDTSYDQ